MKVKGLLDSSSRSLHQLLGISILVVAATAIATGAGLAIWNNYSSGRYDTLQDQRHLLLETNTNSNLAQISSSITAVNASLCSKVTLVNSTLSTSLERIMSLESALNITGTTGVSFAQNTTSQFELINTNVTLLQEKDMVLMSSVANNTEAIHGRIASVNGVNGTNPAGALTLNPLAGITITPSASPSTLDIGNSGVLTIQAQSASDINLVGQCGLNVSAGPMSNEITMDTCALATTINNLDMAVYMQAMQISQLNATDVSLQMQINALSQAGDTIQIMLNETNIDFNMTLVELINQVMLLQIQVNNLTTLLANSNSSSVPTGTIVPFGGLTAPLGYLLCDGSTLAASSYPALEAVIQQSFCGVGGCAAGYFKLPDLRGKVPVAENGATFTSRGTEVGVESVSLMATHMPPHSHTISTEGNHGHAVRLAQHVHNGGCARGLFVAGGGGFSGGTHLESSGNEGTCNPTSGSPDGNILTFPNDPMNLNSNGALGDGAHNHGGSTGTAGTGTAHQNIQPSLTVGAYMIKT